MITEKDIDLRNRLKILRDKLEQEGLYTRADVIHLVEEALDEKDKTISLLEEGLTWKPTHRHNVRGTDYRVVGTAEVQISTGAQRLAEHETNFVLGIGKLLSEGDKLLVYRDKTGKLWARFPEEFEDGRFTKLE
jgi:hypothetical protein